MKISKKGFIFGIIGVIVGAILSVLSFYVVTLISAFLSIGESTIQANTINILQYINFASIVVAIISLCFYFKKHKFSSVLMFLATIMNCALYVYLLVLGGISDDSLIILIGLVPAILFLISALTTLKAKKQDF